MARVGVWKTLAGAAFVTPDAIGFGFYSDDQLAQLQADLESGLPVNKAAGFSGSVYPLHSLRRVHIHERRNRVVVEFTDLLLPGQDDLNFTSPGACREFCEVLLDNLGPSWRRGLFPRRSWILILLSLGMVLVGGCFVAVAISLFFPGPAPAGQAQPRDPSPSAGFICGSPSLLVVAAGAFLLWYAFMRPPVFDVIQRT